MLFTRSDLLGLFIILESKIAVPWICSQSMKLYRRGRLFDTNNRFVRALPKSADEIDFVTS